jgi:hypothetical protein
VSAVTSRLACALPLIACTTCAAVLVSWPASFVASPTVMSFPSTVTVSGALGTPGLRNSARIWLPPSWPQAREVSTTAWLRARMAAGLVVELDSATPEGVVPAIRACALRW